MCDKVVRSYYIDKEVVQNLKEYAERSYIKMSIVVELAIKEYLEKVSQADD